MMEIQKKKRHPPTEWKKGQSGNPNGRPKKGHSIIERVIDTLNNNPDLGKAVVSKWLALVLKGDMNAIKLLVSYMDGMPRQGDVNANITMLQGLIQVNENHKPKPVADSSEER